MDADTRQTLNTVLIVLVTLLQFLLRRQPKKARVRELEDRLERAEARLEALQRRMDP